MRGARVPPALRCARCGCRVRLRQRLSLQSSSSLLSRPSMRFLPFSWPSAVNSVAWAPHELGLHLAAASSDGKVSILSHHGALHILLDARSAGMAWPASKAWSALRRRSCGAACGLAVRLHSSCSDSQPSCPLCCLGVLRPLQTTTRGPSRPSPTAPPAPTQCPGRPRRTWAQTPPQMAAPHPWRASRPPAATAASASTSA